MVCTETEMITGIGVGRNKQIIVKRIDLKHRWIMYKTCRFDYKHRSLQTSCR